MALSTQVYKDEAIALHQKGLSLRAVEKALTERHGSRVVSFLTIRNWVLEGNPPEPIEACSIQHVN